MYALLFALVGIWNHIKFVTIQRTARTVKVPRVDEDRSPSLRIGRVDLALINTTEPVSDELPGPSTQDFSFKTAYL